MSPRCLKTCLQCPNSMPKRLFKICSYWLPSLIFPSSTSSTLFWLVPAAYFHSLFYNKPCVFLPPGLLLLPNMIFLFLSPSPLLSPTSTLGLTLLITSHFLPAVPSHPPPSGRINFLICIVMASYTSLFITLCYGYVAYMSIKFLKERTYLVLYFGTEPGIE